MILYLEYFDTYLFINMCQNKYTTPIPTAYLVFDGPTLLGTAVPLILHLQNQSQREMDDDSSATPG